MPLRVISLVTLMFVASCATPRPEGPVGAQQVNPDIEQRISAEVTEGRGRGFPDLTEIRVEPPKVASAKKRGEMSLALTASGEELRKLTAEQIEQAAAEKSAREKAEALLAAVAKDRRAAARDRKYTEDILKQGIATKDESQ